MVRLGDTRYFTDPSIAAAAIGTLPEGVKLTYDSSKRTIYADIKGNCGLFIVVK